MIGLSRLICAIADVPTGGMQTGNPKVVLRLADAKRIKAELEGVIGERDALAKEVDAANDRNAELIEERDALLEKAKRYDWIAANVKEEVSQQPSEFIAQKTKYALPYLGAYADFCGQISFDESVDIAMNNQQGGAE